MLVPKNWFRESVNIIFVLLVILILTEIEVHFGVFYNKKPPKTEEPTRIISTVIDTVSVFI